MSSIDIEALKVWQGNQAIKLDTITLHPAQALAAALGREQLPQIGDPLPALWHWLYFLDTPSPDNTDSDGHIKKGGFLPPVPLPRRMWASGHLDFKAPLIIGDTYKKVSTVESIEVKEGRSGTLIFVKLQHSLYQEERLCICEEQNLVYRDIPSGPLVLPPPTLPSETPQWNQTLAPDPILLFRYSALTYNSHRIHYDRNYAVEQEGYPALVVQGPLLATLLMELLYTKLPHQAVSHFSFSAKRPSFDIHPMQLQGKIAGDKILLWNIDQDDAVCMSADAKLSDPV